MAKKICQDLCLFSSHLCQVTNRGLAIKIEEYAPEATPTINASEKYLSVSPPKKKSEAITNSTVATVLTDRPTVWRKLASTVLANESIPLLKMFSLILSKITMMSWKRAINEVIPYFQEATGLETLRKANAIYTVIASKDTTIAMIVLFFKSWPTEGPMYWKFFSSRGERALKFEITCWCWVSSIPLSFTITPIWPVDWIVISPKSKAAKLFDISSLLGLFWVNSTSMALPPVNSMPNFKPNTAKETTAPMINIPEKI